MDTMKLDKNICMCKDAKNYSMHCPFVEDIEVAGKKWTISILTELDKNVKMNFSEVRRSLTPITSKILSKRLKELESSGLVEKFTESKGKNYNVFYSLSDKGKDMTKYLLVLRDFSVKWSHNKKCRLVSVR